MGLVVATALMALPAALFIGLESGRFWGTIQLREFWMAFSTALGAGWVGLLAPRLLVKRLAPGQFLAAPKGDAGKHLIDELIADPRHFYEEGRAYQLLQCYFSGHPRDTLRPLLRSDDMFVRRAAAFIISELGADARDLLDDILPLMRSGDRYLKFHAMDALTVCADGEQAEKFAYVPLELEGEDGALRSHAMRLMANADSSQLAAAARFLRSDLRWNTHSRALAAMANVETLTLGEIVRMIGDSDALVRRYGAIAAKRLRDSHPEVFSEAKSATEDPELLDYLCDD